MNNGDIPAKFLGPWGYAAVAPYIRAIPTTSQIGIPGRDGWASLETGFPPLNFVPLEASGVPPFGEDLNGVLFQLSAWSRWQSAGGPVVYDAAFSAAIGGYPKGSILAAATFGVWWFNIVEANTSNPDAAGAGWLPITMGLERAGRIHAITGTTAGPGEHILDGSLLSRASFPALWAYAQASGNIAANDGAWTKGQYSPGDGATTFRIPDYRGYFIRAADLGAGVDPDYVAPNTVTASSVGEHDHTLGQGVREVSPPNTSGFTGINGLGDTLMATDNTGTGIGAETRPVNINPVHVVTTGLTA